MYVIIIQQNHFEYLIKSYIIHKRVICTTAEDNNNNRIIDLIESASELIQVKDLP